MILELSIRDFAIIPKLQLSFHSGMTVLSGETGAGKSIIIDAMGLLVGGRGSTDFVRKGATKAVLEGLFEVPKNNAIFMKVAQELGVEVIEDNLLIQRDIYQNGKNVCRVNGRMVNLTMLRQLGEHLVDIHGQNEHQELMKSERHVHLLDDFGDEKHAKSLVAYEKDYNEYRELKKKMLNFQNNQKAFAQRIDMLEFQINEIESANLQRGEEESLMEERLSLVNYQTIVSGLSTAYEALEGEKSRGLDQVGIAMDALDTIESFNGDYLSLSEQVKSAYYTLQEATSSIGQAIDYLEWDEERLDFIEDRLAVIDQLKRKYGDSISSVIKYYEEISEELAGAQLFTSENSELEEMLKRKKASVYNKASKLSDSRRALAKNLEENIHRELRALFMEKAQFKVMFLEEKEEKLTRLGYDKIAFYLRSNPGEDLKPLNKIASGGELSRIMLALKTIFTKEQELTSIVFDEVDTGVSGRVAQAIADKIHQVSTNSQVLCITHLPQVAAAADQQYFIEKAFSKGRTETTVKELSSKERIAEIARMLGGVEITPLTLEHAEELLKLAHESKKIIV